MSPPSDGFGCVLAAVFLGYVAACFGWAFVIAPLGHWLGGLLFP